MSDVTKIKISLPTGIVKGAFAGFQAAVSSSVNSSSTEIETIDMKDYIKGETIDNQIIDTSMDIVCVSKAEFSTFVEEYKKERQKELDEYAKILEKVELDLKELEVLEDSFTKLNALYEDSKGWKEENIYTIVTNYQIAYCSDEKLKELGITREELQNMSVDALLNLCKEKDSDIKPLYEELDRLKEEELDKIVRESSSYSSYLEYSKELEDLKNDKLLLEAAMKQTKELLNLAEYNCLPLLSDYQNFSYEEGTLLALSNKTDLSPLEKVRTLNDYVSRYNISGIKHYGQLEKLLQASEVNPELAKMYNYLYETSGEEEATAYLLAMEGQINAINGKVKAEKFLNSLKEETNPGNVLSNHLKTSGKGLVDGTESFFEGLAAWFSSSRVYTEDEYETMYILQELQENKNYDFLLDDNYQISSSIGNMLPSVALSMLLSPAVGTAVMGVSAGGNSYHGALVEGQSIAKSITYGVISGLSEAMLEKYLGAIPGLSDVNVTNLKTFVQAMLKEGIEEGTQEYFDAVVRSGLFNEDIDPEELLKNAEKSALYGAIIGGIMNTPSLVSHSINMNKVQSTTMSQSVSKMDDVHGYQLGMEDVNGFYKARLENGFFTIENIQSILDSVNAKGYMSEETGNYLKGLFDGDNDIYLKTIGSGDLASINENGVYCNGAATSVGGSAPKTVQEVSLENTVTKVDNVIQLFDLVKSANGISQGGIPIDGAIILKVPKGSTIENIVYQNSSEILIDPKFIEGFFSVDANHTVSDMQRRDGNPVGSIDVTEKLSDIDSTITFDELKYSK